MDFIEAVKAMRQGKKVVRKAWHMSVKPVGYGSSMNNFNMIDFLAPDWKIVEPKCKRCNCLLDVSYEGECEYCLPCFDTYIKKRPLSDRVIKPSGENFNNVSQYKEADIKEALMDLMVWVTTEHAPDRDSGVVLEKVREIFGEPLLK